jgi:integral membrane sensor domain MASE1
MSIGATIRSAPLTRHRLPRPTWDDVWQFVFVAVSYYVAARAAFSIGTLSDRIFAPFWPPNIVLLCALVFTPLPRWWVPLLAAFPAHVMSEFGVGMSATQMLAAFATNCLFAMTSAGGIRQFAGPPPWFTTLCGSSSYMLICGLMSPALIAFAGAFVPILGGGAMDRYWTFWAQWYASNALGSLTLGPIAIIALSDRRSFSIANLSLCRRIEAASLVAALVAVCALAFEVSADNVMRSSIPAILYSPLPIIIWAAIRFGAKGWPAHTERRNRTTPVPHKPGIADAHWALALSEPWRSE